MRLNISIIYINLLEHHLSRTDTVATGLGTIPLPLPFLGRGEFSIKIVLQIAGTKGTKIRLTDREE